jgi:membrane protease YdiL (CAAX protease family)
MKGKLLYIISIIVTAAPWIFLLEVLPIPYSQISTAAEVTAEAIMFAALLAVVILLKKELKRLKAESGNRVLARILFVLSSLTLFLVGLVLVLIAVSFSL